VNTVRVGVWNAQWASPGTERGRETIRLLESLACDVLCVTEVAFGLLEPTGHVIDSEADYGYPRVGNRRKVVLRSRRPWTAVDRLGAPELPGGRFVSGVTDTPIGPIRFVGVCIPWRDAHVRTGRRDRAPWEDHLLFLRSLSTMLERNRPAPTVLLGDFNQRIPRARQPQHVGTALVAALGTLRVVTAGQVAGVEGKLIDHVAIGRGLEAHDVAGVPGRSQRLSDHDGVVVALERPAQRLGATNDRGEQEDRR
jgi:endonuclease/exonuclease/phosphatase family metal-dependent hydrolase